MTENEITMTNDALAIAHAAITAVDPNVAVRNRLFVHSDNHQLKLVAKADGELVYDLTQYDNIKVISFGKASSAMAFAAADILSNVQSNIPLPKLDGIVIIKDDHATDEEIQILKEKYNIIVRPASHPVPDSRSIAAAEEILRLASSSNSNTLILACISGGGSALFCSPRDPLTLEDLMAVNSRLLGSGMNIEHMNVIRKRLEKGKGGGLAASAYPATVLTLVLSDIIGDPLDLIASGPTVPDDGSTWEDAWRLVNEYGLNSGGKHELPHSVLEFLWRGKLGELDDTPKSSHLAFSVIDGGDLSSNNQTKLYSETVLVGNNYAAVLAAAEKSEQLGYNPVIVGTRVSGEASIVAGSYISMAEILSRQRVDTATRYSIASLPAAIIAGGETVVTLPTNCNGKGGRNQELALSAAIKMKEMGLRDVVLASIGTDGTDGPTDAAGAVVYGGLVNDVTIHDAKEALTNHDAYTFLDSADAAQCSLVRTGPTGTNVADVCITLVH
jgi:glycerate 2-kinase